MSNITGQDLFLFRLYKKSFESDLEKKEKKMFRWMKGESSATIKEQLTTSKKEIYRLDNETHKTCFILTRDKENEREK